MTVTMQGRPVLHALISFPIRPEPETWTAGAVVSLEVAAEMKGKGYIVLVDPQDERDLAMYERLLRAVEQHGKKKWYEA